MNNAPCGFVAFADDGTIVEVNQRLATMLDYSRVELLGWHVDKLFPPGGRIFYHTYLFPMLKVQDTVEEIAIALRTRSGTDVPVLLNGIRHEREGRMLSDCICVRTIQRHEFEDRLIAARRLAEESAEAKARFLSMLSHDLRTPLTTIYGNAELLATGAHGALTAEQAEAVDAIREATRMQMTLVSDILEFARLDSGKVQLKHDVFGISDIMRRAIAVTSLQVDHARLRLVRDACSEDVKVVADPERLMQVVLNLLTNAMKYTPPGGSIRVACDRDHERVRIHIGDTGVGISPAHVQQIFAPFVQIDEVANEAAASGRGVGLGLAISRDLVRAMGGDITVTSTPGNGSVFTIELPAAPAPPVETGPAAMTPA